MWRLVEKLHIVSGKYWVFYSINNEPLGDFPDNGISVVKEIVHELKIRFDLDTISAYQIWKNRIIEC